MAARAMYLAKCMDPSHKHDKDIVSHVRSISGIKSVTAIPNMKISGKTYCIIARAEAPDKIALKTIRAKIRKHKHLGSIDQLTAKAE